MIGQTIGNYRIESQLGRGGMGVVYKAIDVGLERPVAVKMLPSELASDPQLIERFRSEAKAQATLNHPNIAGLYAFFQHGNNSYMVMEFISGQTMADIIRQTGPIPHQKAIPWFKQALLGIGVAHRRGIIHRDIKPNNLMVTEEGIVKVMDFGIARAAGNRRLTGTGMLVGTLPYMSPEQVMSKDPDIRSDIYALGITLYEMVTGRLAFEGQSDFQLMKNIVEKPPPPPKTYYPYLPDALQAVILRALEKDPNARYQSVEEFGAALEMVERGGDIPMPSQPSTAPVVPPPTPGLPPTQDTGTTLPPESATGQGQRPTAVPGATSLPGSSTPLPDQPATPVPTPAGIPPWQQLIQNPKLLIGAGAAILLIILITAGITSLISDSTSGPSSVAQGGSGGGGTTPGLTNPSDGGNPPARGPEERTTPMVDESSDFVITEKTLDQLRTDGVPDDVLRKLQRVKNQRMTGAQNFSEHLRTTFGDEIPVQYMPLILRRAEASNIPIESTPPEQEKADTGSPQVGPGRQPQPPRRQTTARARPLSRSTGPSNQPIESKPIPPANQEPRVTLQIIEGSKRVEKGQFVRFRAQVSDPEQDRIRYGWRASTGRIGAAGSEATLNTSSMSPGPVTVTVTVDDGHGHPIERSATILVKPVSNVLTYRVAHDHSGRLGAFSDACYGRLRIFEDRIVFQSNEQAHGFVLPLTRAAIKEVKMNRGFVMPKGTFHIKPRGGGNYNLAYITRNGQRVNASPIVITIKQRMK